MSFLNDLIGAKERYTEEAQKAKEEAEHAKRRMEDVTQQNLEKELLICDLEEARVMLSGKAEQDGQEAEQLRAKVSRTINDACTRSRKSACARARTHARTHTHTHARTHARTHTHTHTHARTHARTRARTARAHTHAHTHVIYQMQSR